MRVVIVGAGGVGGLVGGMLARSGADVAFVARGAHLAALRSEGLHVDTPKGAFQVKPVRASDDPAELGPADVVLVAVKAWQVPEVAPRLRPLVRAGTVVVPLENGVESAGRLAEALGDAPVLGGLCHMLSWVEGPGRVKQAAPLLRVTVGERGGGGSDRVERVRALLASAGIEAVASPDVEAAAWEKFLFIETWGTLGAVTRAPIGALRSVPETRALLEQLLGELAAVGRARGVKLPPEAPARALALVDALPEASTASMQRDVQAGRPSELEDQTGSAVRMARAARVPAPAHEVLYAALLPQERAARGRAG